jgi:hypothetical protein
MEESFSFAASNHSQISPAREKVMAALKSSQLSTTGLSSFFKRRMDSWPLKKIRAEQSPQFTNGRFVLVRKTATLARHTGQGVVPICRKAGCIITAWELSWFSVSLPLSLGRLLTQLF